MCLRVCVRARVRARARGGVRVRAPGRGRVRGACHACVRVGERATEPNERVYGSVCVFVRVSKRPFAN
eukprot:6179011-Pleurochrysis_carterae.AAC.1